MKLINTITNQFLLMLHKKGFWIAFLISTLFCITSYLYAAVSMIGKDKYIIYSADAFFALSSYNPIWNIFKSLYPFLVVLPFAFSYLDDQNLKIYPYFIGRVSRRNYYLGKMIVCFLGGFIIISIPFLINLFLCHITFPHNNNTYFGDYNSTNYFKNLAGTNVMINTDYKALPFLSVYLASPLLYNILYLLICSVFTGIMGMFSLAFSFLLRKGKLLLFIPSYLLFYLSSFLNTYSGGNNDSKKYVNSDWVNYLCVDDFCGKSYLHFIFLILCVLLFTSICMLIVNLKYWRGKID